MNDQPGRLVINAHDLVILGGIHLRTAQRILNKVRKKYNKPARSMVTITEFCDYMKLDESNVKKALH